MNTPDNKLANRRCDANDPTISTVGTFLFCANLYCGDLHLSRFLSGDLFPRFYHIRLRILISDDNQNTCFQDIHKKNWKDKPVGRASHKRYNDQLRLSKHKLIAAFVQQKLDTIIAELWVGWPDKCVGNVVPQHYSLTSDCLIKSHSKKVTPITVPKAALVSSEAKNLYWIHILLKNLKLQMILIDVFGTWLSPK